MSGKVSPFIKATEDKEEKGWSSTSTLLAMARQVESGRRIDPAKVSSPEKSALG